MYCERKIGIRRYIFNVDVLQSVQTFLLNKIKHLSFPGPKEGSILFSILHIKLYKKLLNLYMVL